MEILPELLADVYRLSVQLKFEILLSMESLHPNEVVALSPSPFFSVYATIKKMSVNTYFNFRIFSIFIIIMI